jgi:hypothetical protein
MQSVSSAPSSPSSHSVRIPSTPRSPFVGRHTSLTGMRRQASWASFMRVTPSPTPDIATSKKVVGLASAIFTGLIAGVVTGGVGMMILAMVSLPLANDEEQEGLKKITQYVIKNVISCFGATTAALFAIRTSLNVGRNVYDHITRE